MPSKTSDAVEQAIVDLQRAERLSRDEIAHRLKLAPRTVSRVLARHGMPPLWDLDPMTGEQVHASKKTTTRYEREHPGELVHRDVKKLGYDFVHSLVDDNSRLAYSEVLPDEKGPTCAAFLERALAYFATHGITRVERLITDNAWACADSRDHAPAARKHARAPG